MSIWKTISSLFTSVWCNYALSARYAGNIDCDHTSVDVDGPVETTIIVSQEKFRIHVCLIKDLDGNVVRQSEKRVAVADDSNDYDIVIQLVDHYVDGKFVNREQVVQHKNQ